MSNSEGKAYQPSNGSEGDWFIHEYCMQCLHCDPDPNGEKQCDTLCLTMCYGVDDPEYPKEWIYNDDNKPVCTKWQKWDWGNDDDGRNEPPEPEDPNQIMLFSVADDVLKSKEEELTIN